MNDFVRKIISLICLGTAITLPVFAFTPPTQAPPGGNVVAPLNTSNVGQSKQGGLILNTGGAAIGLIVEKGSVGIGTTNPETLLDLRRDENSSAQLRIRNDNTGSGATSALGVTMDGWNRQLGLNVTSASFTPVAGLVPSGSHVTSQGNSNGLRIFTQDPTDLSLGTNRAIRMTIKGASGNPDSNFVGIGTTNPQSTLHVVGTFTASGAKNFMIDHPLDPKNKTLTHSSLEGPEIAVYYRGEARLEGGRVKVALPDYFEALTRKDGRTVQLTPVGGYSPLYVERGVENGSFIVATTKDGNSSQSFYWEVKAVRSDMPLLETEKSK